MEKYNIICEIGRGAFGIVRKAQNKETKEIVAIKQMVQEYETWEECINLRELKSLRKLTHPNIVKLKEVLRVKKQLFFVFECLEKNIYKLYETAKSNGATSLADSTIKVIIYQIASALAFMHKHGFFHRDLKPENLLISSDNLVKLIDFGLAREIRSRPPYTDYVSTRWYRAPEILLRSTNYNSPVDIFALGCIMAELYLMKPLFNGTSEIDQLTKITSVLGTPSKLDWPDGYILASQKHFTFPSYPPVPLSQVIQGCPPDGLNLISEMMKWDPQKRITPQKMLSHPYFNGIELPEELQAENIPMTIQPQNTKDNSQRENNFHSANSGSIFKENNGNQPTASYNFNSNQNNESIFNNPNQAANSFGGLSHSRVQSTANISQVNPFSSNFSMHASSHFRQQSPPPAEQSGSSFGKQSGLHGHYQSSSPDQRYSNQQGSKQSDINGFKGYEMSKGIQSTSQPFLQSSSLITKKNLDPIYEFLSNDVMSINAPGTSITQLHSEKKIEKPNYDFPSKQKIDEDMEEIEQEILGTYLPSNVTRVRQGGNQSNSNNNPNNLSNNGGSMFGDSGSNNVYSNPTRNRGIKDKDSQLDSGYVPSAMGRNTSSNDNIYKFDAIKPAPLFQNQNNSNQSIFGKSDLYNFDNLLQPSQNQRKIQ